MGDNMAGKIKVYSKEFKALGSTSKAFNISKTEELMREYTLSFSVVNNDSIYPYIGENSVYSYNGQYFDVAGIDGNSGETNITQVTAEHISYRLSEYTLPNGYAFVGTVREIAADILHEAKTVDEVSADNIFSLGVCADKGTLSFATDGNNVTARAALIAMSELGVEIEFDNFTVNVPERRGADNGMIFSYAHNLAGVHRTWQKGNGWSYEITIADLQKIPGHSDDTFILGDDVLIKDSLARTDIKKRIISYTECDDPTQNKVVVGVFIRDSTDVAVETDSIARNAIQEREKYSNVSISHTDGFKAESLYGDLRVMMNADDCFVVQAKQSDGTWKTVSSAELWGMLTPRLATQDSKNSYYGTIGKNSSGNPGFFLMRIDNGKFKEHFSIWPNASNDTVLDCEGDMILSCKTNKGCFKFKNKSGETIFNISESGGTVFLEAEESICLKMPSGSKPYFIVGNSQYGYNGNISVGGSYSALRLKVTNGIITGYEYV